jgi:enterochelin esterase-like enzyme
VARKPIAVALLASTLLVPTGRGEAAAPPAGFTKLRTVAGGGSIWRGVIPGATRKSAIYLPRGFTRSRRYPVVYLLPGMPGSPWSYVNSLSIGALGDTLIARAEAGPFIAVMPVAGPSGHYDGEWAGPWEHYLVHRVVPWVDAHLPTVQNAGGRTLAGLSAGGYGAIDIGLRHPLLFGCLESWGGYFQPFADGPLHDAGASVLADHDPTLLAREEAALLRRRGVRFFLSSGPGHDRITPAETARFARELRRLGIRTRLELLRPQRHVWERQLAAGLRWALAPRRPVR